MCFWHGKSRLLLQFGEKSKSGLFGGMPFGENVSYADPGKCVLEIECDHVFRMWPDAESGIGMRAVRSRVESRV